MMPMIDLGVIQLNAYWTMAILGFIVGIAVILFNNKHHPLYKLPLQDVIFLILYIIVGVMLGARLMFVITYIPRIIQDPSLFLPVLLSGGLVFYGGLIGGVIMGFVYVKQYGLDPIRYANLFILAVPAGHAFGRVGCFMTGCCYGRPTDAWMGVVFPEGPVHPEATEPLHPTQLYETAFNIVLFIVMLGLFYKYRTRHKPYVFIAMYMIGYGLFRFINEFFRGDLIRGIYILSTSQWISLFVVAFGVFLLIAKAERLPLFKKTPPRSKSYRRHLEQKAVSDQN